MVKPTITEATMARGARPTLADVAAQARVSVSTASLAFSGAGPVSPAARERVRAAADALGYAGPDPIAASLRRGTSGVVGVIILERLTYAFRDPFAVALLESVAEGLADHGLSLLLVPTLTGGHGDPQWQLGQVPLDAALYVLGGLDDEPSLPVLRQRGIPMVGLEGPRAPDVTLISIADRAGSAAATRHLTGLGHRDIAVVAMPWRLDGSRGPLPPQRRVTPGYPDVSGRLRGVEDVIAPGAVWECAASTMDEGAAAARVLLCADRRPTAIVAQSDLLAAGVLLAAAELGVSVPDQLSVVGFDGVDLPWLGPAVLTTVVQPVAEKGRLAAEAVLAAIAGSRVADRELPVSLRVGSTTGPPPAG